MDNITPSNKGGKGCRTIPSLRFTWPGEDESVCCVAHALMVKAIAEAIGMHLQFIVLTPEEKEDTQCRY